MSHPLLDLARSLRACLNERAFQKLDGDAWTDDMIVEVVRGEMKKGMENFYTQLKKTFEGRIGAGWQAAHSKFLKLNRRRIAEIVLSNEVDP